jgi:hypothetical protein
LTAVLKIVAKYSASACSSAVIDIKKAQEIAGIYVIKFLKTVLDKNKPEAFYYKKILTKPTLPTTNNLDFENTVFDSSDYCLA